MTGLAAVGPSERSYALLADGTTLTIRPAGPGDYQAVKRLHETMLPDNLYFRFFSMSEVSAEREARRICLDDRPGRVALLGLLDEDQLVGVASYELQSRRGDRGDRAGGRRRHAPPRCGHAAARAPGLGGPGPRRDGLRRRGAAGQLRRAAPAQRLRAGGAAQERRRRGGTVHVDPAQPGPRRAQRLPGRRGRSGPAVRSGQPGAAAEPGLGGGDWGEPRSRLAQPGHLAQHPPRRFRRTRVRGQPARW